MMKGMFARNVSYMERKAVFVPATEGTKCCKSCLEEKPITAFSPHANMKDGRLNKCRKCRSAESVKWFKETGHKNRTIDRERKYKKTGKQRYPEKHRVRSITSSAVKSGKLVRPKVCSICNGNETRIEAHHPDYSKPLEVVWMCVLCHNAEHMRDN